MEAYLSAAGKISRLAIGDVSAPTQAVFEVPADTAQNYHIEGLPFGTRGGILIKYQFPADGEYTFKVKGVTGYFQAVLGGVKGEQLEVTVDGERVKLFDWDKEISTTTGNGPINATHPGEGRPAHRRRDIPGHQRCAGQRTEPAVSADHEHAGLHPGISVLSARRPGLDRRPLQCRRRQRHGQPQEDFRVPPGHRPQTKHACARTILSTLVKHAYRRPATPADLATLMEFYQAGRSDGGSFDDGIEAALQRVLADPEFVYRQRSGTGRLCPPARATASAIWRWLRGCRFSCGAAFPTTS